MRSYGFLTAESVVCMREAPLLASLFHTIAAVISGFTTAFWFMVFIGAMALLIFMPAPSPKPKAEEAPAATPPEKNSEEAKWRQMLYATDAKWRRMMVMMHLQNTKQAAQPQPPVHVNIIASPDMLRQMNAGAGAGLLENSATSNDSAAAQNNLAPNQDSAAPPNAARKRFRLPRAPKLALPRPRPRRAAKTTADEI